MTSSTEDDDLHVNQSKVNAADAPAPKTTAPNSVFALGASLADGGSVVEPAAEAKTLTEVDRIVEALRAGGRLGPMQISELAAVSLSRVKYELPRLAKQGKLTVSGKGRGTVYGLPTGGFKGWLKAKGQESAEGRAKRPPKAVLKAKRPLRARVTTALAKARTQPVVAVVPPSITCGIFSTGEMLIEAGSQSMRIARDQAHQLYAWLAKVDALMQA